MSELTKYLDECDKNEKEYEEKYDEMFLELDELIKKYNDIAEKYDLKDEAKEYMEDEI